MGYQSSSSENPNLESTLKSRFDEDRSTALMSSYAAWLRKHPSALESFEGMMMPAKGKSLVVFLDYDGTLSPIVEDPDQAFISDNMRSALQEVACIFPTAIVTGRRRDKVKEFVQLHNVIYAGSHGMDMLTPVSPLRCNNMHKSGALDEEGDEVVSYQPAKAFLPTIQELLKVLKEKTKTIKGAMIEDNKFCISVHFRRVNIEDVNSLKDMVKSIIEAYSGFRITGGRKVIEIRPRIDWDKGRALQYLIQNLGFNDSNDFLPLYIGDDKTDEDAFKVIKDVGRGYPVIVSSIPKETKASYSLRDTNEVMAFLVNLVNWKKSSSASN
ncbi:hypothetical protein P3X46_014862 [Hevea brasiliensis]|uniref:Trehalose 6-phosphate phosphatase n=1 Tax=Hevea brasiliensis TaxID=3981 RepID=A0ABQ9LY09_HEVBR|nr:probable trehalose-phosphate phosphatase 4 [Hevea brasiliensis]KAJ9171503.1 hypothetical protein P3X46_014862 [Hevea brasiliensis]